MSEKISVPTVYALAMELDADERIHLLHLLLNAHHETTTDEAPPIDWLDMEGIAPNLLDGEDAQEWVSRTRRADTLSREARLSREE